MICHWWPTTKASCPTCTIKRPIEGQLLVYNLSNYILKRLPPSFSASCQFQGSQGLAINAKFAALVLWHGCNQETSNTSCRWLNSSAVNFRRSTMSSKSKYWVWGRAKNWEISVVLGVLMMQRASLTVVWFEPRKVKIPFIKSPKVRGSPSSNSNLPEIRFKRVFNKNPVLIIRRAYDHCVCNCEFVLPNTFPQLKFWKHPFFLFSLQFEFVSLFPHWGYGSNPGEAAVHTT